MFPRQNEETAKIAEIYKIEELLYSQPNSLAEEKQDHGSLNFYQLKTLPLAELSAISKDLEALKSKNLLLLSYHILAGEDCLAIVPYIAKIRKINDLLYEACTNHQEEKDYSAGPIIVDILIELKLSRVDSLICSLETAKKTQ